jgi:hypothetical protein
MDEMVHCHVCQTCHVFLAMAAMGSPCRMQAQQVTCQRLHGHAVLGRAR